MNIDQLPNLQLSEDIFGMIILNAGYDFENNKYDYNDIINFISKYKTVSKYTKNIIDKIEIDVPFGIVNGFNCESYSHAIKYIDKMITNNELLTINIDLKNYDFICKFLKSASFSTRFIDTRINESSYIILQYIRLLEQQIHSWYLTLCYGSGYNYGILTISNFTIPQIYYFLYQLITRKIKYVYKKN